MIILRPSAAEPLTVHPGPNVAESSSGQHHTVDTQLVTNVPKPTRRPGPRPRVGATLISYMALSLLLSWLIWGSHGLEDGTEWMIFIGIYTGAAVGCFLILFAVYRVGWLLRAHAQWLAEQQEDQTP